MDMSDELSATAIKQVHILGTQMSAQSQLQSQEAMHKIRARAHKDYQPSTGMCDIASAAISLTASEGYSELTAMQMARRSQDRILATKGTVGIRGDSDDMLARINQYKADFCDPADNKNGLGLLCRNKDNIGASKPQRINKDIDFYPHIGNALDIGYRYE